MTNQQTKRPLRLKSISVKPPFGATTAFTITGVTRDGYSFVLFVGYGAIFTTVDMSDMVRDLAEKHRVDTIYIDSTGIGSAVIDLVGRNVDRDYEIICVDPTRLR